MGYKFPQVFKRVHKGLQGITRDYKGFQGFTGVQKCLHGLPGSTGVYNGLREIYRGLQGLTGVYGLQEHTGDIIVKSDTRPPPENCTPANIQL